MIFQSFLLGNLGSLWMKIINLVVVVGLYYGFLTTFSIGPSYLFLLRALVMEEGTEKKVSTITGFITGHLMMFISIYCAPLHLVLGRPHTITILALPYLFFNFFWNNHKDFFLLWTTRNSMRNLSNQRVFPNNLIFKLFNHFLLPSSMLATLVNLYLFRCNNKILFVTNGFLARGGVLSGGFALLLPHILDGVIRIKPREEKTVFARWGGPFGDREELRSLQKRALSVAIDSFIRVQEISQEISQVEEEKLQSEQSLGLFWEHFPPLDPEAIAKMMQEI
nr:uncharacterized mitochondrial protein AtMg00370-like [Nicotiana tomentosiformis]